MGEMDHKDSYCCDECCEGNMRVLGAGLDGAGKASRRSYIMLGRT